ncbi:MAG: tetratricopeptide repeat protein [Verrucomicrobia bacterium]|nr:tetratricopeptide repeat protein [Verrucomicrobiota bacterium]MCH8512022.1 tetratricopeptide repeat protein [Kiritimatiellia bacterium]
MKSFTNIATALLLLVFLSGGCASLQEIRRGRDPLTPVERLNLGVTYEQEGKLDLALREYQRAERGSMKSNALAYQGNVYVSMEEFQKAERHYRAALKENPDNLAALNNLAHLLAMQKGALQEAEALIRHALSLDPRPREPFEDTLRVIQEKHLNERQ